MPKKFYGENSRDQANLPQEVKRMYYPKQGECKLHELKDNMEGLDMLANDNKKQVERKKYNPYKAQ